MRRNVVLVCGGRDYDNKTVAFAVLDALHFVKPITRIVQGGDKGGDALGKAWAKSRKIKQKEYPADWLTHKRAAGPIRNREMFSKSRPNMVLALPGGVGTADMISVAKKGNCKVLELDVLTDLLGN